MYIDWHAVYFDEIWSLEIKMTTQSYIFTNYRHNFYQIKFTKTRRDFNDGNLESAHHLGIKKSILEVVLNDNKSFNYLNVLLK